jgi:hypothetical protein
MANTENIEAKLAAYVDGELDAAERAEIEQHLATNEEHRKLIEELRVARDYLRQLPREQAPPDVAEMLNAQLERAALLGDVDLGGSSGESMRISRWPQIRAIAAILLLTLGLTALIIWVLPSPKAPPQQVAVVTPDTSDTTRAVAARSAKPEDVIRADAPPARGDALALDSTKDQNSPRAEHAVSAPGVVAGEDARKQMELAKRETSPVGGVTPSVANSERQGPAPAAAAPSVAMGAEMDKLKTAPATPATATPAIDKEQPREAGGRAYLLVSAADTSQALGQVVRYLDDNKIQYRNVPSEEAAQQGLIAGQTMRLGVAMKADADVASSPSAPATLPTLAQAQPSSPHPANRDIFASRSASSAPVGEAMANSAVSNSGQTGTAAALPEEEKAESRARDGGAAGAASGAPATQNAVVADSPTDAAANRTNELREQDANLPSPQVAAGSQVLLAQNLTRQQAAELGQMVSQPAFNQTAQVVMAPADGSLNGKLNDEQVSRRRAAEVAGAPTTKPTFGEGATAPLQAGDSLRCTFADGAVREQLTVDDDGNVTLPQLGVVRAAGLTPSQLAEALSQKMSVAMQQKVPTDAAWTVERIAPQSTLGGAGGGYFAKDTAGLKSPPPATEPMNVPAAVAAAPATQASRGQDRVDLWIIVQNASPSDSSALSTTPAAPAASQPVTQPTAPEQDDRISPRRYR